MKQISATLVDFTASMKHIFPHFLETVPIPIKMTRYYSEDNLAEFIHEYRHQNKSIIIFYLSDRLGNLDREKNVIDNFRRVNPKQKGFIITGGDTVIIRHLITGTPYLLLHKDEPMPILAYYLMQGCCNRHAHSPLVNKINEMVIQPPLKARVQYLNDKEKAVMQSYLLGMDLSTIAKKQQSPKNTIASRKYSAMRKLSIENKIQLMQLDPEWLTITEPTHALDSDVSQPNLMPRKHFSSAFKVATAKLVLEQHHTINQAASLNKVSISSVRKWVAELKNNRLEPE
ncbi:Bacterial regulatory proteins, luxR family [Serratia liquefaciens]|uniref:hypothetical protein n=1 Tax=Serratia liquefaciens TaxID=614 RepID=UPI0021838965|nr:hypothetical protein [Serratia liquefaciens]CAI2538393.1 Bacterial regulatory proteins, luxR family [Serratia liquefaciens]